MDRQIINEYVNIMLAKPIPDNRGKRHYTTSLRHMDQKTVDGKKHIVFVAYYPDPHVLKKARTIRKHSDVYLTFIGGCIREDAQIETCFDQYYEYETFHDFYTIAAKSSPYSWHAVTPYYHAAIIIAAKDIRPRLVVDIVDAVYFVQRDHDHFDVKIEAAILKHADVIVHKMPSEAWGVLEKRYQLGDKGVSILSYPEPGLVQEPIPSSKKMALAHAVYAGGVIPYRIALERGHQNHIFDPLIDLASADTFELSIYVNQNARDMPWHQHTHYYAKEKENQWFHFKKGRPYHQIAKVLSAYSVGIFYDNIPISAYRMEHFKFTIASKFFTYLEAGLPIIVYREAEHMADLVRNHDLGALYSAKEPRTIVDAVKSLSDRDFSCAIRSFCKRFSMAIYGPLIAKVHGV